MRDRAFNKVPIHALIYRGLEVMLGLISLLWFAPIGSVSAESSLAEVMDQVHPKIVKIYGAGGLRGLESYQSGSFISSEGHILTAWSYVLDSSVITVVLDDGRRFVAELTGADPRYGIAVLKVEVEDVSFFHLDESVEPRKGDRVLAFSNLFGIASGAEPASVLKGYVSAITNLDARRSVFPIPYKGKVYIVDAVTNNPGAAGGVLTDQQGRLAGLQGKEIRSSLNDVWLNYAVPMSELREPIEDLLAGKSRPAPTDADTPQPAAPLKLNHLGIVLIPNVLEKTPPYVERSLSESQATKLDIQPDDLIMFVNGELISSQKDLHQAFRYLDRDDPVQITVLRDGELLELGFNEIR
ncbi:MAG: S1C family serine protease [Pirellulaceae bacterium]